jgi:hypothetical protein
LSLPLGLRQFSFPHIRRDNATREIPGSRSIVAWMYARLCSENPWPQTIT